MQDPSLRPAMEADAKFVAWAILAASRGHLGHGWFDVALERPEVECLAFLEILCTAGVGSWWHYSNFLTTEVDGRPVVALSAFRAGDVYAVSPAVLTDAMKIYGMPLAEQAKIWERGAYLYGCSPRPDDNSWVIEHVCVLPQLRGRGYVSTLLEEALEQGRRRNLATAQITHVIGNTRAHRAYQGAGFLFSTELRDKAFAARMGCPGLCQHSKLL